MLFRSINKLLTELGWRGSTLYLLARFLARTTGGWIRLVSYQLVMQPVPEAPGKLCRSSAQNPVRRISAMDDPLVAHFPRSPEVIARRFNDGHICLVAISGERFAGFLWLAHRAYNEDEVRCCYELVSPDLSVWDFDVYVEPAFRFGRTFARLWSAANVYLAERGIRWSFSRISTFNTDSLSAHTRLGLRRFSSAMFLCFGQVQIAIIGISPFVHVSWSGCSPLILRLRAPARW